MDDPQDSILHQIRAKFLGRYPRHARNAQLQPVLAEEADFYPCPAGMRTAALLEPPSPEYRRVLQSRRNAEQPTIELLCYRLLKKIYGLPDPVVAFVDTDTDAGTGHPYDWGWTLRAGADLVEVRRRSHSVFLDVWVRPGREEQAGKTLSEFSSELDRAIRRSHFLFDAKSEIASATARAGLNIYLEKYRAGKELMALGEVYDRPTEWVRSRVSEDVGIGITGTLYQAAIVMFYISLDAFEQALRQRLSRPGLQMSSEMTLEDRLRTIADDCIGFTRAPLSGPKSYLEKRVRLLRRVRNQVVHGQATPQSQTYGFTEDAFVFMYQAEQDEPHTDAPAFVPVMRLAVRRHHAEYVRDIVDEIVNSTIRALDAEHAHIGELLRKDVVLPIQSSPVRSH